MKCQALARQESGAAVDCVNDSHVVDAVARRCEDGASVNDCFAKGLELVTVGAAFTKLFSQINSRTFDAEAVEELRHDRIHDSHGDRASLHSYAGQDSLPRTHLTEKRSLSNLGLRKASSSAPMEKAMGSRTIHGQKCSPKSSRSTSRNAQAVTVRCTPFVQSRTASRSSAT